MLDMVKCPFKLNFDDLKDLGPTGFLETPMVDDIMVMIFFLQHYHMSVMKLQSLVQEKVLHISDVIFLALVFAIRDLTLIWRIA